MKRIGVLWIVFAVMLAGSVGIIKAKTCWPNPDHIVVVIMGNKDYSQVIGNMSAPWINHLTEIGTLFQNVRPSECGDQKVYLRLFSGSSQSVNDQTYPHSFSSPNLASTLASKIGRAHV